MENQPSSSKQIMLTYGAYMGLASILNNVVLYALGDIYRPHWGFQVVSIILTVVLIVLALKVFKQSNEGLMSLSQALKIGLGASVISGVIYIVYMFAFTSAVEPDFFANAAEVQYQTMVEKYPQFTEEQLEAGRGQIDAFAGMGPTAAVVLIMSLLFGFIISLIAGLFMKRTEEDR